MCCTAVCQEAIGFKMYFLLLCRVRKIVLCLILSFAGTGRAGEKAERKEGCYNGNRNFQSEY